MKSGKIGWTAILLLALFFRLVGLDLNPVGLSHDDELHDLINAKSLAITGTNVPGVIAGILTQDGHCLAGDCIYAELESYAHIPWMWLFPLDMVLSKIPFVLASVGLVWATGKLFENLSKNSNIGKISGLLLAINPWAIYYGRTAYSYTFTFLLFILAAYSFTRAQSFKSNLILGGLSSFGASLFYFGAKPIFPLIILWGVICNLYQFKFRYLRFTLLFLMFASFVSGVYFFVLFNSYAGRRFLEIGASDILIIDRIRAYLGFFSVKSLFLSGQIAVDNYFMSGQGYFYLIELPFFILGLIAILISRGKAWLILLLVAIAVLPAAIKTSGASIYSLRSGLAYPLMIGMIAWGYYWAIGRISKVAYKKIFIFSIVIFYFFSVTYFLFLYWYKAPVDQATRWFLHERVMTDYIKRLENQENKNVVVLAGRPDGIFNSYVFYSGIYEKPTAINEINSSYLDGSFKYQGVKFINQCGQLTNKDKTDSVIFIDKINQVDCGLDQKNVSQIANPRDAGGVFNILNESLCSKFPKQRFPMPKSIFDFRIENLSDGDFCRLWITNPDNY